MGDLNRDIRRIHRLLGEGRQEEALGEAVVVLSVLKTGERSLKAREEYQGSEYESCVRILESVVADLGYNGDLYQKSSPSDNPGQGVRVSWLKSELEDSKPVLEELPEVL